MNDVFEFILKLGAIASATIALISIIKIVFRPLKTFKKQLENMSKATICLLRKEMTEIYYRCMERGFIRTYERKSLVTLYDQYSIMGGNCYIRDIYEQLLKMPISDENEL